MTTMTVDRPAAGSVTGRAARPAPNFLTAPLAGRTWREQGYLALALLLAPFAFTYTVFAVSFTASIAVTVVGLFVAGAVVLGARGWGAAYRSLARELLDADVAAPPSYVRPRGFWRTIGSMLGDAAGWRALLFMFIAFPLSILSFVVSITFLATGLGGLTYWFWYRFLPPSSSGPTASCTAARSSAPCVLPGHARRASRWPRWPASWSSCAGRGSPACSRCSSGP